MGAALSCVALNVLECFACLACSCCKSALNYSMSQAARLSHILIILSVFTLAIILGTSYADKFAGNYYVETYTTINITQGCDMNNLSECIYRQLIYRASFALVILFSLLALFASISERVNKGFWILKFLISNGIFIGFFWINNDLFTGWAEVSRVIAVVWLFAQSLLLLDASHDIHDIIISYADAEEIKTGDGRGWYALYLAVAMAGLSCSGVGLAYLFKDYAGCSLGMFFVVLTCIFGVISTILSVLTFINKGILTPSILFAYAVFLTWYSLLSSSDVQCNPYAYSNSSVTKKGSIVLVSGITIFVLLYCVINGTVILNIFNPQGQGVMQSYTKSEGSALNRSLTPVAVAEPHGNSATEISIAQNNSGSDGSNEAEQNESSGSYHERLFFHILMILVSSYGSMILTSWGNPTGAPTNDITSKESMWFKIISLWIFMAMYLKSLHASYLDNKNNM